VGSSLKDDDLTPLEARTLIEIFAPPRCRTGHVKMTRVGGRRFKSHTCISHEDEEEVFKKALDDDRIGI
jgi:hypothetical protein